MSERHSFTVYRDRWIRGDDVVQAPRSSLLRDDGHQCCVGFYLSSLGMADDQLHGCLITPAGPLPESALWIKGQRIAMDSVFNVNDLPNWHEGREDRLTAIFAENGVDVTFADSEATA